MGRRRVTWNVRGLGKSTKREVTKLILQRANPDLVLIQESRLELAREETIAKWARSMGMHFEFVLTVGSSGGIITLWKDSALTLQGVHKYPRFLVTVFQILPKRELCLVINVYGPNSDGDRGGFFADLRTTLEDFSGGIIIGGDFNATLNNGERKGT